jgi:8-oxo-dGTP diphosphatase
MKFKIGAFVQEDDRVLLIKKNDLWDLPESNLDKGINIISDLKRDVKSETGLEIEPESVVAIFEDLLKKSEQTRIYFKAKIVGGKVKENKNFGWFTISDMESMEVDPTIKNAIDNYRLGKFIPMDFIEKFKR